MTPMSEVVEAARLRNCRLPNGLEVACIDEAEVATLYREIFTARCWLDRDLQLSDGAVIVDVGANIGMSTLFFHTERRDVRLLCFEPAPPAFAALQHNVERHSINAICRPVALGARPEETVMTFYPDVTTMSGLRAAPREDAAITRRYLRNMGFSEEDTRELVPDAHRAVEVPCRVTTLPAELRGAGLSRVDLLKIDVEKSELAVLDGIDEPTWGMIDQVALEAHDIEGTLDMIVDRLRGMGFRTHVRQDPYLTGTNIYDVAGTRNRGTV